MGRTFRGDHEKTDGGNGNEIITTLNIHDAEVRGGEEICEVECEEVLEQVQSQYDGYQGDDNEEW